MRAARSLAFVALTASVVGACVPGTGNTTGSSAPGPGRGSAAASPVVARSPSFVPPTPTPAPTFLVVTVKRGDSLNSIAHTYGTSARSIAFWNRATYPSLDPESAGYAPERIQPGWTLALIPQLVYDEDSGDAVDPSGALPAP